MAEAIYKVGDKVKLIENDSCSINEIGDVGTVMNIIETDGKFNYQIQVDGKDEDCNWSYEEEIELGGIDSLLQTNGSIKRSDKYTDQSGELNCEYKGISDGIHYLEVVNFAFGSFIESIVFPGCIGITDMSILIPN